MFVVLMLMRLRLRRVLLVSRGGMRVRHHQRGLQRPPATSSSSTSTNAAECNETDERVEESKLTA